MTITITPVNTPAGKVADVELHFADGDLAGMKLIGFSIWERRTGGYNVTFPSRTYSVNGDRRTYALLRPLPSSVAAYEAPDHVIATDRLRDVILAAWTAHLAERDAAHYNAARAR